MESSIGRMNWSTTQRYISPINIFVFMAVIDLQLHILPLTVFTLRILAIVSSEVPEFFPNETPQSHITEYSSTQSILTLPRPTFSSTPLYKNAEYRNLSLLSSISSTETSLRPSKWLRTTLSSSSMSVSLNHSMTMTPIILSTQNKKLPIRMKKNDILLNTYNMDYNTIQPSNFMFASTVNSSAILHDIQYESTQKLKVTTTTDDGTSTFKTEKKFSKNFNPELMVFNTFWTESAIMTTPSMKSRIIRNNRNKHHHEHHWGPFFEEPINSTVSDDKVVTVAHLFTEAALNCRVGMLKDKTVMWLRRTTDKVSLLTVANVTYSSDPRIQIKFQYPNNWRLLINPTQWSDTGVYMCQVSTHPPRVFTTNLTIIEPPLRLVDEQERDFGDRYYKTGSSIDLQCQVSRHFLQKEKLKILQSFRPVTPTTQYRHEVNQSVKATIKDSGHSNITIQSRNTIDTLFKTLVFWSKDDVQLPPRAYKRISTRDKWLTSRISIKDAKISDSGNYSCSLGRLFTAIVQVQVLTGQSPAAVQHNSGHWTRSSSTKRKDILKIYITIILHIIQFRSHN